MADDHGIAQVRAMVQVPEDGTWLDGNPEGFEISKGHMFDHTAAFAVLWGANDNARLDNFEKDHQKKCKTSGEEDQAA